MGDDVILKDDNIPPMQEEMYKLYTQGYMTDITLSCEDGKIFEAHKVILASRSSYFYNLIPRLKGDPVIFLKGIKGAYLEKVLKYVYSGTASVPKVILRAVFDVARSLQIRGLVELSQTELGRGLPGPSGSRNVNLSPGGSYKSDTDSYSRYTSPTTREARENALKQQQQLYEKFSSNSQKSKANAKGTHSLSPRGTKKTNRIVKDDGEEDTEAFSFKYQHISDDSDDQDQQDRQKDGRKRSKNSSKLEKRLTRKESKTSSESDSSLDSNKKDYYNSSDSDSSDNSDLDSDDSYNSVNKDKNSKKDGSRKREPSPSLDDYLDDSPSKRNNRRPAKGPTINGQSIIAVQCKGKTAELYLNKFCNGSKGKSIIFKGQWMTPDQYEKACGSKTMKYLDAIKTDYGPLKALVGAIKPHSKKCKCVGCSEEEDQTDGYNKDGSKPNKSSATTEDEKRHKTNNTYVNTTKEDTSGVKRKPKEQVDQQKRPKHEKEDLLQSLQPTTSSSSSNMQYQVNKSEILTEKDPSKTKELSVKVGSPTSKDQSMKAFPDFLSPPICWPAKASPGTTSTITTMSTFSTDSFSTGFSLSSPSPANHRTTLGSSIIPNPSQLSGIPSPSTQSAKVVSTSSLTPVSSTIFSISPTSAASKTILVSSPSTQTQQQQVKKEIKPVQAPNIKPPIPIQMGPPKIETSPKLAAGLSPHAYSYQVPGGRSRIGPIMQVKCKTMSAYLYTSKYESGSKGKCILMGDEWLTPNEFEEKSGSKAKKYLSSIKCLGRPLRSYVNSGELRGSSTPQPSPKMQRLTPKPPAPIAPAPPVSHGGAGQISMQQLGMAGSPHLGQSYAPVAMAMTVAGGGQPILINQSNFSVANTLSATGMQQGQISGASILTPMTFTLAPMAGMDNRQNIGVQQQIHQSQHIRQEYIIPE